MNIRCNNVNEIMENEYENDNDNDNYNVIVSDDILSFYYQHSVTICKSIIHCSTKHTDLCIHDQLFAMMKYLKPKYSDNSILSSFTSLFHNRIIYVQYTKTINTMIDTNLLQGMLTYLNNDFWTIYDFQPSLRRTSKTNILMPMEAILENEYVDTDIFRFH